MSAKGKDYTVQASIGIVFVLIAGVMTSVRVNNLAQAKKDAIAAAASPTPTATPAVTRSPESERVTSSSRRNYGRSDRRSRRR